MLPKLFENKKNLTILSQRDLAKVTPPSPPSEELLVCASIHHRSPILNPSLITYPKPITHHRSINPSTTTASIKPTDHLSQTHHIDHQSINPSTTTAPIKPTNHRSINPSTTIAPIKPINPTNPSAPIKNQTLHHPPPNPATTKQTHHNIG